MRKCLWGAVLGVCAFNVSATDVWAERQALDRIQRQLKALDALVAEAQRASDPERRLKFDYSALRSDLSTIDKGIEFYLETPMEPASIKPMDGEYEQYGQ